MMVQKTKTKTKKDTATEKKKETPRPSHTGPHSTHPGEPHEKRQAVLQSHHTTTHPKRDPTTTFLLHTRPYVRT